MHWFAIIMLGQAFSFGDIAFTKKASSIIDGATVVSNAWAHFTADDGFLTDSFNNPVGNDTAPGRWQDRNNSVLDFLTFFGSERYYLTNGLGEVRFSDAANQERNANKAASTVTNAQPLTLVTLVKLTAVNQQGGNTQVWIDSGTGNSEQVFIACVGSDWVAHAGSSITSSGGVAADTWYYHTFVVDGASSLLRVNGTQVASGNAGGNKLQGLRLGQNGTAGNFGLIGRMREAIVFTNRLTADQIIAVERWLTNKYSL